MTKGGDDLADAFASVDEAAGSYGEAVSELERQTIAENSRRVGRDRSWIAKIIIGTYAIAVVGVGLFVGFTDVGCSPDQANCVSSVAWEVRSKLLFDLVVTAVVPIVTLMLGFYFGTEASQNSK
ncbi:hypothetical protein KUV47_07910 [Vannielia litorea]|uniref:hypothetical protein n=1 Tax=Vannielia litorea TaxID=1217970 RepID=UPI001C95FF28|nr:hypothetical protein [Vannielia litorea]MBY6153130.1 hypothetical protein [Vannielia litorea]